MNQCRGQLSMFSAEDSLDLASPSALPGSEEARRMTVTSGLKCLELYQNSGPLGSLVRMLLGSSIWRSTRCTLTWKTKVTPSKRLLFRLVPSMPRTDATDARLSGVERWKENITGEDGEPILWKTPIASDSANREFYRNSRGEPNLSGMVKMFPTPTRFDATCGDLPGKEFTGTLHAMKMIQAAKMWPTPIATDWKNRGCKDYRKNREFQLQTAVGGQLNPDWVEWLQGFPIGWTEA